MSIFKSIFPSGAVINCITENHRKEKLSDLKRAMVPPLPAASRRRWRHGTVLDTAKHSTIQKWNTAPHTTGEWCSEVEIRCDEKAPEGESNLWLSAILFLLRYVRLTTVYLPRGTSDPQFRPFPFLYLSMYLVLVTLLRAVCLMQQCALDAAADAAMCSQAMLCYAGMGGAGWGGCVVWRVIGYAFVLLHSAVKPYYSVLATAIRPTVRIPFHFLCLHLCLCLYDSDCDKGGVEWRDGSGGDRTQSLSVRYYI